MRKLTLAASFAALFVMGGSALADGLTTKTPKYAAPEPLYVPASTWAGFYFGANGGYAFDASDSNNITVSAPDLGASLGGIKGVGLDGGFGGAQIGYNWQAGRLVFGVEADIQIADLEDKQNTNFPIFRGVSLNTSVNSSIDWFGTVRGRIGYAFDSTLIYFTGGFAYAKVNDEITGSLNFAGASIPIARLSRSDTDTGYVLGGGIEFKPVVFGLGQNWTMKAEYQYINLDSERLSGSVLGLLPLKSSEIDHEFHTVRVGLNYHIPNDYVPLK